MVQTNGCQSENLVSRLEVITMLCQEILQHEIRSENEFNEILRIRDELVKRYENLYNEDAPDGLAVDRKKSIQCDIDEIKQLAKERNFYYLIRSINIVLSKIKLNAILETFHLFSWKMMCFSIYKML